MRGFTLLAIWITLSATSTAQEGKAQPGSAKTAVVNRIYSNNANGMLDGGPIVDNGISPVTAIIPYQNGFLTAFAACGGKPEEHCVHWSQINGKPGAGEIRYKGVSPVTAMAVFQKGVLTAFSNADGKRNEHVVRWSADGKNLGGGEVVYRGVSPVTSIVPYKDGVLVAFLNSGGKPNEHVVLWSPNGKDLGGGEERYKGASPVTAMVPYEDGVLVAFSNSGGKANEHVVLWSPNGKNLGGGEERYKGISPVTAMLPHKGGVLVAFSNFQNNPFHHGVHWSVNGKKLGGGPIRYKGDLPVVAMVPKKDGVLTALSNYWPPDGDNAGVQPIDQQAEMEFSFEKLRPLLEAEGYQAGYKVRFGDGDNAPEITLLRPPVVPFRMLRRPQPIEAVDGGILVYGYWAVDNVDVPVLGKKNLHGHLVAKMSIELRKGEVILSRIELIHIDCTDDIVNAIANAIGIVFDFRELIQEKLDDALGDIRKQIDAKLKGNKQLSLIAKDVSVRYKPGTIVLTIHNAK